MRGRLTNELDLELALGDVAEVARHALVAHGTHELHVAAHLGGIARLRLAELIVYQLDPLPLLILVEDDTVGAAYLLTLPADDRSLGTHAS